MRFLPTLAPTGWFQRAWLWQAGIYLSFWVELRLFTDLRLHYGPLWNPVLFYASSLLLCVFAGLYWLDRLVAPAAPLQANRRFPLVWIGLVLGAVQVLYAQAPVIAGHAIDVRSSDIIPILQAYVARFRSGEVVYRYLTTLPYPLFPNHLPMQWLPYVPADELGIDYRWWAMGILLLLGFGAYQFTLARQPLSWLGFLLKVALPSYVLYRLITYDGELYAHPVEPTIIAYYCVLAASVLSRSALLQAVALVLCLLSRYSVVFWVPFYLWVLWREAGRRHAITVAALVLAGVVGIYVVPFLSKDCTIFTHALSEYRIATLGEWSRTDGLDGYPPQLFAGVGLASWFYTYGPADIAARIGLLQKAHVLLSVGAVLLAAGLYHRLRLRFDYRLFALIALKFYLATFYAFIQIPYPYLTSLGLFISVFLVMMTGAGQQKTVEPSAKKDRHAELAEASLPQQ
ncbi:hypothetical protein BEN47_06745 [Hymenobacter lapidarius]|uniref:Glycosyltransferase RgtA/B/C/D-like domain-containing protein n=1 Tax=Hymenobacter lapidarius TaxID=1908237 RepID=A0A1G1TFF3_9BACT|nr:hypothetical protein [Hymenobacter lapidarius]OGX89575.1 hypothetical protein BEN47_06745 [Hymenobacter lapidarius]